MQPADEVVRAQVKALLAERLKTSSEALTETSTLEHLGLDSLLLTETVTAVEDHYDLALDVIPLAEVLSPTLPLSVLLEELTKMVMDAR
ncbi:acyl carrier protein [Streptomyces sp. NPDC006627]|uniref:acyl carrier protein n=1 Tax=Streptomyces sp. NPDC006627 TaxID=3154679 RepID=UPI0033ABF659